MAQRILGVQLRLHLLVLGLLEAAALLVAPLLTSGICAACSISMTAIGWVGAAIFAATVLTSMAALGIFSSRQRARTLGILLRIAASVVIGLLVTAIIVSIAHIDELNARAALAVALVAIVLALIVQMLVGRLFDEDVFKRRVLVYGTGTRATSVTGLRRRSDTRGFRLIGFVKPEGEPIVIDPAAILRPSRSLLELAQDHDVQEIVVAMDDRRRNFPLAELLDCRLAGIDVTELVSFLERETGKVRLDVLNPSWIIFGEGFRRDPLRLTTERVFDVACSLLLLALVWPFLIVTALLIKLEDGWGAPVLYRQVRVGYLGRHFDVLKFRSMRVDAEVAGKPQWAQKGDSRVTRVGGVIRKIRIDELPQILNVLRGDMSFVGPRPERPQFVEELATTIPYYDQRHYVKPGITGWAQLCYPYGASAKDAAEKLQYDLYYVKNHSLLFDVMVLLQTAEVILLGKGAR